MWSSIMSLWCRLLQSLHYSPIGQWWQKWNLSRELYVIISMAPHVIHLEWLRFWGRGGNIVDRFLWIVRAMPDKDALVFTGDGRTFSFHELNQVNIQPKDMVALMVDNSPEFIILFMAALKISARVAFINPSLKSTVLLNTIQSASPICLIFSRHCTEQISAIRTSCKSIACYFVLDPLLPCSFANVVDYRQMPSDEPSPSLKNYTQVDDIALLIYTSGTTGKSKPAQITHARFRLGTSILPCMADITVADRIYTCLPLYHSAGSVLGFGACLSIGATCVLAPKFSASAFIDDCRRYRVTAVQYIGELARFVLATPVNAKADRSHSIRVAVGNGIRPDVWKSFQDRFGINEIVEFYASTEGNASLVNHYYGPGTFGLGAVGRMGPLARNMMHISLVQHDPESEMPIRDGQGHCTPCQVGETGELISKISAQRTLREFRGYYRMEDESAAKVLLNVFREGDRWYRSGDLLRFDENNFFYFVDRIGDTFRWKGENISSLGVAEAFSGFLGVVEANVYGVRVPHAEGRAGMATLTVSCNPSRFNSTGLYSFLKERLMKHAIPVWIRLISNEQAMHTATLKQVKFKFKEEGFNPQVVTDRLLWIHPKQTDYTTFTNDDFEFIHSRSIF